MTGGHIPDSLTITPHETRSGVFVLRTQMWLPRSPHEVFAYFGDARNLETITPPWLRFRIVSGADRPLQRGALIDYRLRIHGWPIRWRTEIAEWQPPFRFIDQQLRGPYRLWHHEHTFEAVKDGTIARDRVDYTMFCAGLANRLMVGRDLLSIFRYRQQMMARVFGEVLQASD